MKNAIFIIPLSLILIVFMSFGLTKKEKLKINQLSLTESSTKAPSCRKFIDICPDGSVGYHCAYTTATVLPLCKPNKNGSCNQIWSCDNSVD